MIFKYEMRFVAFTWAYERHKSQYLNNIFIKLVTQQVEKKNEKSDF